MSVFITGGNGFLGTNLTLDLARSGEDVTVYDVSPPKAELPANVHWVQGDLLDKSVLSAAYDRARPTLVFHLAARTDLHGRSVNDYATNTRGTINLMETIRQAGNSPRSIYASSRLVFDIDHKPSHDYDYKPSTPYGESKVAMEEAVRQLASHAGPWTIVRPTSLWGPWFGIPYRDFFDAVRKQRYVNVEGRPVLKSYGYVGTAVHQLRAISAAPTDSVDRRVLWISDPNPLDLGTWASLIAQEFGVPAPRTVPLPVLRTAAMVGDLAKSLGIREPPITSFRLHNLLTNMTYDVSETSQIAGAAPFTLEEGVVNTVAWIRQQESRQAAGAVSPASNSH